MKMKEIFKSKSKFLASTLAAAVLIMLVCMPVFVQVNGAGSIVAEGTCADNLTWKLDDAGVLTISGTGKMNDSPWESYGESIKSVVIESGVTSIGYFAFFGTGVESITIPDTVTHIYNAAFFSTPLANVTLPDSLEYIGADAFGDTLLTNVHIPASVTSIDGYPFRNSDNLQNITVDAGNPAYVDQGGVLYTKDMTKLIGYPAGRNDAGYTIPDTVTTIGKFAFCSADALTSMVIPNGVTSIGNDAFAGCAGMKNITIPTSVTSIGRCAFEYDEQMESVYYKGSEDEWNAISIDEGNEPLLNARIYYNVCDPGMHVYTNYIANNDGTCVSDGTETAECDICEVPDTRTKPDSKGLHSFTSYYWNDDATCQADGTETAECDNCTETDTRTVADSKTDHNYENGVCTMCGAAEPVSVPTPGTGDNANYPLWIGMFIISGIAIALITVRFKLKTA